MDSFEPVRAAARNLHSTVVAAGCDSHNPEALALAAVRHLELELVYLSPQDPALKQARALFDEQSGTICCEQVARTTERALLVAHEVGHVVLHAGSLKCHAEEIDPSRSMEAAPVGLQRVEDYGARERRELQANVFAREFLLPRRLAEELHVVQRLGATQIAQLTGLPLSLVRQQLFDALLLPQSPPQSAKPALANLHDSSQERAVVHRGAPFQLQAGPGTGKTRTLVRRVLSLLEDGVDPGAVLVLTFSNRAAGELAERLESAVPEVSPRLWIGTIHAFGLDLVRRYHDRLNLPPDPALFDRSDAIEVLEEILPTLSLTHYRNLWDPVIVLRDIIAAISRAKDELIEPAQYRTLADAMLGAATSREERTAAEKCVEVADVYRIYEGVLRKHRAVDFGDLIMRPTLLLESDPALVQTLRLRHRHLLVDEYQDVNRASARLLKALADDGKRLWVVGDARQSIYRFRGASAANMALFAADYPGAIPAQLHVNYRSTKQIVETLLAVAPRMGASKKMLRLSLSAERGPGLGNLQVLRYDTPDDEIAGVAAGVQELESAGVSLRDQAVLCRSNARLNEIAVGLEARGVPVLHLGSLFEREEIRDFLALLSLAADRLGDALTRVATSPRYDVDLQDIYIAVRHLRSTEGPALKKLDTLTSAVGLSPNGEAAFKRLAQDLTGMNRHTSAWDFLSSYLLDRTDCAREMARATNVMERMRAVAVWQFLNFLRVQSPVPSTSRIQRTLDRVRQLVLLAEERDLRQVPAAALQMNAVRLMTVHGSKGLEFEAVHLPGITASSFPIGYQGQRCPPPAGMIATSERSSVKEEQRRSHEHEEQCLFFVALSRARDHLRLYVARKQRSGKNRSPSTFLDWLPSSLVDDISTPSTLLPPASWEQPASVEIRRRSQWSITGGQLRTYEKCPRRFFYTHVLGLGGARKRTPFSQTHDCLYELVRWFVSEGCHKDITLEEAEAQFQGIWAEKGPIQHAFARDYRQLASRLIGTLVRNVAGGGFRHAELVPIDLEHGTIRVEPDAVMDTPDGKVALLVIRTGYRRTNEYDRLEYALYLVAATEAFGGSGAVRSVHLTDGQRDDVSISPRKLSNRRTKANEMLGQIANGRFPAVPDAFVCARCPHFFICPSLPRGALAPS